MPSLALPLLAALLPLMALATLQFALPVLAPLLMAVAGRPPEDYGWVGGALGLGAMWFYVTNGVVTPALGPLRTLRAGILVAICGLALVLTGHWGGILAGAMLIGYGYATTTPAGSQILADFTPRALWGTLFSVRQAGVPVGGIAAGLLGAFLASGHDWRLAIEVLMAMLALVGLGLLLVPRRFNAARPLQRFRFFQLFNLRLVAGPFRAVRRIPNLATVVAAGVGLSFVHSAVTSFFVIYLKTGLGFSLSAAAGLFALLQGTAIVGRVGFGMLADRLGSPLRVLQLLAPLSSASALILSQFSAGWPEWLQILAVLMIGMTVGTWNGLYLAEIARLAPPDGVSEATAGSAFFSFFAYMLGPPLVGFLATTIGYRPTFACMAMFALFSAAVLALRSPADPGRNR